MNNASAETRQQRRFRARQERKTFVPARKNAFHRALSMAKSVADALQASMALGPITMKLAMMDLAFRFGQYKSRGHGRGTSPRRYGQDGNNARHGKPHQSGQECLRRAVGGWGHRKNYTGMTKMQTLAFIAGAGRMRLETAIQTVRGISPPVAA